MVCDNDRCKHLDVVMHDTITTYNFLMDFLIALLIYFKKKNCLNKNIFKLFKEFTMESNHKIIGGNL